jgi:chemosensory pili system protein ChpA (sensor histidine kinase/response regulator)
MPEPGSFARGRLDTVLLVDDYVDARETVRELLERNGHSVVEASDGQQALNFLVSQSTPRVGLILLDLHMPVMDGFQFLKLLGNYVGLSKIPVIVVSAHTARLSAHDRKRVAGCLQAPYDPNELVKLVQACMPTPPNAA